MGGLRAIFADPYQLHRSLTTLRGQGLPVREFPQTQANTTRMGQALFDLLNGRNLRLYASPDLRQQALNTVAVESGRGFRVAKERASRKVDAIVALAMACVAALDDGPHAGLGGAVPLAGFGATSRVPVHRPSGLPSCGDPVQWLHNVNPVNRTEQTP
jgi:hypothetical protein